jgi:plastocyanin
MHMLQRSQSFTPFAIAIAAAVLSTAVLSNAARPGTGTIAGHVTIDAGGSPKGDNSKVVVYLEAAVGPALDASQSHRQIVQHELKFSPELTVVAKGSTIDFPNDDKVFHNVFSLSEAARFDLGLYKKGESKSVTFTRTGVVDLYCNIHPEMVAKIKIVDGPYFAVTAADGAFKLSNVPAGKYPIVAWQANGEPFRAEVTVSEGQTTSLDVKIVEGDAERRHLRKDGTPYGRYK